MEVKYGYWVRYRVEATLLGLVLGGTCGVSIGLLTVALCHYLGVARLTILEAIVATGCIGDVRDGQVRSAALPKIRQYSHPKMPGEVHPHPRVDPAFTAGLLVTRTGRDRRSQGRFKASPFRYFQALSMLHGAHAIHSRAQSTESTG